MGEPGSPTQGARVWKGLRVRPRRVLCETVKDFVARVGKAYEKTTEGSEESEVMAKKVRPGAPGREAVGPGRHPISFRPFLV